MWFTIQQQSVKIIIYAKPNAKNTLLVKVDEKALHISLHAKPQQGEANKELIEFLSALLKIPKSQINLLKGEGSRYKQVVVPYTDSVKQFLQDNS